MTDSTSTSMISETQASSVHETIGISTAEGKYHIKKKFREFSKVKNILVTPQMKSISQSAQGEINNMLTRKPQRGIGPDNLSVFDAPDKMNLGIIKYHCDSKWLNVLVPSNLECCVQSSMFRVLMKISSSQAVIDELKDDRAKWTRIVGGGVSLLTRICSKKIQWSKIKCYSRKIRVAALRSLVTSTQHPGSESDEKNKEIFLVERSIQIPFFSYPRFMNHAQFLNFKTQLVSFAENETQMILPSLKNFLWLKIYRIAALL